jgi:CBS domain-containing protein
MLDKPKGGEPMITVDRILKEKGNRIWSVSPDTMVFDALNLMAEKNLGAVLVIEGGKIAGILSERDYARKVALKGRSSKVTAVKEIMTEDVLFVRPNHSIEECMALMTDKHIRHLPVVDGEQLVGVISIGDVVKAVISDQEYTIKQLENYIAGHR